MEDGRPETEMTSKRRAYYPARLEEVTTSDGGCQITLRYPPVTANPHGGLNPNNPGCEPRGVKATTPYNSGGVERKIVLGK